MSCYPLKKDTLQRYRCCIAITLLNKPFLNCLATFPLPLPPWCTSNPFLDCSAQLKTCNIRLIITQSGASNLQSKPTASENALDIKRSFQKSSKIYSTKIGVTCASRDSLISEKEGLSLLFSCRQRLNTS